MQAAKLLYFHCLEMIAIVHNEKSPPNRLSLKS